MYKLFTLNNRFKRLVGALIRLGLTAVALGWVSQQIRWGEAADIMAQAPWWAFAAPVGLMLVNSWLHALRVRLLLRASGHPIGQAQALGAMLKGLFLGLVLPTGGSEIAKVGFLARLTGRVEPALAAMGVARVQELLPWGVLLVLGLGRGLWAQDPALGLAAAVCAAGFFGVAGLGAVAVLWGHRVGERLPGRLGSFARAAADAVARMPDDRPAVWWALGLSVPFALINALSVWVVCQGYALNVGYGEVLKVIPAADALISLPVTVSGVGVREGVMARALAPYGATPTLAVAIALTRWAGELGRAAIGAVLFVLDRGGPRPTPAQDTQPLPAQERP